ncbi:unnamed protein product [Anisakis simplex]|uniref:Ig-like domain-containing protein n=1 Tax=Anisakis simplex TaxID=6269 RepID=A0A0M3JTZ7_ANISI|nr:unnamed protein product [Anisakis simplex]
MDEIVLIESPVSTYIVRSKPAELHCRALNARQIRFKCNGRWLEDSRVLKSQGKDPSTQLPYLRGTVEISRQEVDANIQLGDYTCQCYASGDSDSQAVRSDSARIRIACKFFVLNTSVEDDLSMDLLLYGQHYSQSREQIMRLYEIADNLNRHQYQSVPYLHSTSHSKHTLFNTFTYAFIGISYFEQ